MERRGDRPRRIRRWWSVSRGGGLGAVDDVDSMASHSSCRTSRIVLIELDVAVRRCLNPNRGMYGTVLD